MPGVYKPDQPIARSFAGDWLCKGHSPTPYRHSDSGEGNGSFSKPDGHMLTSDGLTALQNCAPPSSSPPIRTGIPAELFHLAVTPESLVISPARQLSVLEFTRTEYRADWSRIALAQRRL